MHNKLSQVDKKFLRTSCAEKRWVDDGSGLAQILEDELHLTAREVPVVGAIARGQQRGHQAVGMVDVTVEPTQRVRDRADGEIHRGKLSFGKRCNHDGYIFKVNNRSSAHSQPILHEQCPRHAGHVVVAVEVNLIASLVLVHEPAVKALAEDGALDGLHIAQVERYASLAPPTGTQSLDEARVAGIIAEVVHQDAVYAPPLPSHVDEGYAVAALQVHQFGDQGIDLHVLLVARDLLQLVKSALHILTCQPHLFVALGPLPDLGRQLLDGTVEVVIVPLREAQLRVLEPELLFEQGNLLL